MTIPPVDPVPDNPRVEMHGHSAGESSFTQIGMQVNIQPTPAPPEVRYSLPPDTLFVGREDELQRITAEVTDAANSGSVVAIHAIDGIPGVGKTALAVHAAHELRQRFPDRQLFIDLHAHTPGRNPVLPEAALAGLLTATGVDPRYLPGDLDGRIAMWRDRMSGQRALIVLDNAATSNQVTPLLPGGGDCLVLITSRRHLGDLPGGVVPLMLEVLPLEEANAMFKRLAPRTANDPDSAVEGLVRLAGLLPLAISLLARVYAEHISWTLDHLIDETRANLLTLKAENESIAAALMVSFQYLDSSQQYFFRRLGLHLGSTIDGYAAAALNSTDLQEAIRQLDSLHREGLITEIAYRRYGMHDLIRRYARDVVSTDLATDRQQSMERLVDYYQYAAAIAEARLARIDIPSSAQSSVVIPSAIPDLGNETQALTWARVERANLLACLNYAVQTNGHARVVALAGTMAALLRHDGPWSDAITWHTTAIQAARRLGDRLGEAGALTNLGEVKRLTGDFMGAGESLKTALGIYRDLGDRRGEAAALTYLGTAQWLTGDNSGASESLEHALMICRDLGDRRGEAAALTYLGEVRRVTGNYSNATPALESALNIYRDLGDRIGEARVLTYLGEVRRVTGDYIHAAPALESALGICRDLGDRRAEAAVLNNLGIVRRATGDYAAAAQALEEALNICRDLGDPLGEAGALAYLGVVRRNTGDYSGAAEALESALAIYRHLGDRGGEAETLNETGTLYRISNDLIRAVKCHEQALMLARQIKGSWDEAHALAGLGRCAVADGRVEQGAATLKEALELFERIGAAETSEVRAELNVIAKLRNRLQ